MFNVIIQTLETRLLQLAFWTVFSWFPELPLEQSLNVPNSATSLLLSSISLGSTYIVVSITYKTLQSGLPSYLHSLLNVQSNRTTRSSDVITLQRPSIRSRLKVTNSSFTYHGPVLCLDLLLSVLWPFDWVIGFRLIVIFTLPFMFTSFI